MTDKSSRISGLLGTLIISFIAIAVFGFSAMGHAYAGHTHGGCIAAIAQGLRGCSNQGESAQSSFAHIATFKGFSQSVTANSLVLAGFLAMVVLLALTASWIASQTPVSRLRYFSNFTLQQQILAYARAPFLRWLALHELRSDHDLTRVHLANMRA